MIVPSLYGIQSIACLSLSVTILSENLLTGRSNLAHYPGRLTKPLCRHVASRFRSADSAKKAPVVQPCRLWDNDPGIHGVIISKLKQGGTCKNLNEITLI